MECWKITQKFSGKDDADLNTLTGAWLATEICSNHIGIFYYRLIFNKTEKKYSHSARHVQRRMKKAEEEQELN